MGQGAPQIPADLDPANPVGRVPPRRQVSPQSKNLRPRSESRFRDAPVAGPTHRTGCRRPRMSARALIRGLTSAIERETVVAKQQVGPSTGWPCATKTGAQMTGRLTIAGLCALCVLAFGGLAASAAFATNGTTGFTCTNAGGGQFSDAHCKEAKAGGSFAHTAIPQGTTTELSISNETTGGAAEPFKLKYRFPGGTSFQVTATGVSGTGWLTNAVAANGEHYMHGEATLTLTGVTAVGGCKAYTDSAEEGMPEAGVIHTEPLVLTTKGEGDSVRIEPKEGSVLARFYLTECLIEELSGTGSASGGIKGAPNGATVKYSHVTTTSDKTLSVSAPFSLGGAGVEGSLTLKAKDPRIGEDTYKPISPTTVET